MYPIPIEVRPCSFARGGEFRGAGLGLIVAAVAVVKVHLAKGTVCPFALFEVGDKSSAGTDHRVMVVQGGAQGVCHQAKGLGGRVPPRILGEDESLTGVVMLVVDQTFAAGLEGWVRRGKFGISGDTPELAEG